MTDRYSQETLVKPGFKNNLHDIRVKELLSIADLARLAGLSVKTISDIEHSRRTPREVTLHQIVNAINSNSKRIRSTEYSFDEVFPATQVQIAN